MKNEKKLKYFSMFTGVGGFELGIGDRAECVGFSEIDKYASELLRAKWSEIKNYGDATKIIPSGLPDFDMLCGGFPCQAFSIAGQRKGFSDTRGTLFFDIARIVKIKRPKIVFLENVKGLLNHEGGKTFRKIIQTLSELGYNVQWMVLNSKFFGVPQNRERVFIIGSLRDQPRPEILPFRESNENLGQGDTEGENQISDSITSSYKGRNARGTHVKAVLTPDRTNKRQNGRRFKEEGEPSFTLTGRDIHGIMENANCVTADAYLASGKRKRVDGKAVLTSMHERRIRRLTPVECARLQGFPDNWTEGFSDTQRYKMMGNAVTVNVIKAIMEKL